MNANDGGWLVLSLPHPLSAYGECNTKQINMLICACACACVHECVCVCVCSLWGAALCIVNSDLIDIKDLTPAPFSPVFTSMVCSLSLPHSCYQTRTHTDTRTHSVYFSTILISFIGFDTKQTHQNSFCMHAPTPTHLPYDLH